MTNHGMSELKKYSLAEIGQSLKDGKYPISGITRLGSAEFYFQEPASYLGVALHNGSRIRPELVEAIEVEQEGRFREEDPYTDYFLHEFRSPYLQSLKDLYLRKSLCTY